MWGGICAFMCMSFVCLCALIALSKSILMFRKNPAEKVIH